MPSISAFDPLLDRACRGQLSVSEAELLAVLWAQGEDGWLREDDRFRPTPWGHWIPTDRYLINDQAVRDLRAGASELSLKEQFESLARVLGCAVVFCPADPRLRLDGDRIRLAPSELTTEPLLEEVGPLLQYLTHLPVLSLKAAAASQPAGEWGSGAESQHVEARGWLRIEHLGRPLNRRMFVAQIKGHSMDGGARPIEDGSWAIFEFTFHEGTTYDPGTGKPTVLVRGDFADPETGSYAVKRWDREAHEIRLVSSNPDREHYPDIVVPRDSADHLRVVATLTRALSPGDFARRPKPQRHPGRRVLEGASGLAEVGSRLDRRIASFFEGKPNPDDGHDEVLPLGWQSRLVCLAPGCGGPHLEIGPLSDLPPFVRKLRAVGAGWDGLLLASNARQRPARITVRPGSGPWLWQAVGFEDEEDLELDRLEADALPDEAITVFRVDANGVGRRQSGTTLARGQEYRLLVPPGTDCDAGEALVDGWRLWELELTASTPPLVLSTLRAIGLDVGAPWPRLEWALRPPSIWRSTTRGECFPVFQEGAEIYVQLQGLPGEGDEPSVLFLRGSGRTERRELPVTSSALVSLGEPPQGRWACALLHPRTDIRSSALLFEVAADPVPLPDASWTVEIGDGPIPPSSDLSAVEGEDAQLRVKAPACWPVSLAWRVFGEVSLATAHADDDGSVDLAPVLPLVAARARRSRAADLVIDLDDLGRIELAHAHRPSVEEIHQRLASLWARWEGFLRARPGAWLTSLPHWFEPVAELLGYGVEPLYTEDLPYPGHALAAWGLVVDERVCGTLQREAVRVLVLTTDLGAVTAELLDWVDQVCSLAAVREAIISDGISWTTHRRGNRLVRAVWELPAVLDGGDLEPMLADLAEGI